MNKDTYNSDMKFDLHCHSNASDGKLSPADVALLVTNSGVKLFALTDHDTLAGFHQIKDKQHSFTLVSGVEFSCVWQGVAIHIIGLDFDPGHSAISGLIDRLRNARKDRAILLDQRLAKKGMADTLQGALTYCPDIGQVGRPHFAEYLLKMGYVKTTNEAFDRWLGNGKIGDIKTGWPEIIEAVSAINKAGGVAVLAHPLRYKLTFSKMRKLIVDFKSCGGAAVEVLAQQAQPEQKRQLIQLIKKEGLAGSGGSDFHDPDWQWAQIGNLEALPEDIIPVWSLFKRTPLLMAIT